MRRLTPSSIENAALYYLQRYAATEASLRRVLLQKIRRLSKEFPAEAEQARTWIEPLIARYRASGLLNDAQFASLRAASLRRRGGSSRSIQAKLRQKGIEPAIVEQAVRESTEQVSELQAARALARKKKLGAYRVKPAVDLKERHRDMAVLARAGFSYNVISMALREDSADDA